MPQFQKRTAQPMDDEAKRRIVDQLRDAAARIELGQDVAGTLRHLKHKAIAWYRWSRIGEDE